ncbi:MAG: hypothetical protein JWP50_393 [Phenylobacterium sp.]|nr:hypothetical protein [Phenylobacterium sp.]
MVGESRPAPSRGRTLAIAASIALHALVLLLLVWRLGTAPRLAEAPVMSVELTPPWPEAVRRPAEAPRRRTRPAVRPKVSTAAPDDRPAITRPDLRAPSGPVAPSPGDGVRQALRGLGCEHAALLGLTPEERRRCEDRLAEAARRQGGPARLNLDVRGAFGRDAEPYLQRRPKNGCKLRAGGDVAPMGEVGAATGVACAWSF